MVRHASFDGLGGTVWRSQAVGSCGDYNLPTAPEDREGRKRPRFGDTRPGAALLLILLCLMLAVSAVGCSSQSQAGLTGEIAHQPPPELNESRAYLKLSQIQPAAQKPKESTPIPPLTEEASRHLASAQRFIAKRRYTRAAIDLEKALRVSPESPEIQRELATMHWQSGNVQRARIHAGRALDADPRDARSHYILGRCAANEGDTQAAIHAYRTSLLCGDDDRGGQTTALCHYYLAQALADEGYLEAALNQYAAFEKLAKRFHEASAGDEDVELASLIASTGGSAAKERSAVLERLGRYGEAAAAVASLAAKSPGQDGLRYARLLYKAGRFDEALATVRSIPLNSAEVIALIRQIYERLGRHDGALSDLRARFESAPDEPLLALALADVSENLGQAARARDELDAFLDRHPDADTVRQRLVKLFTDLGDGEKALRTCADGLERQPNRIMDLERMIAPIVEKASTVAGLVEANHENDPPIRAYLRGLVAVESGRLDRAELFLRQALTGKAGFLPARAALGRVYFEQYRYDEALSVIKRANPDVPEDARLEILLGRVYERLDDADRARKHFRAAIELEPDDPEPMFLLAKAQEQFGDTPGSQRQLRLLIERFPNHEAAREMLALSLLHDGKSDATKRQLTILQKTSKSPITQARCQALLELVQSRDARAYRATLREAIDQGVADDETYLALAESYGENEQAEAAKAYRKVLTRVPDSEEAALGLVFAEQRLLKFEDARDRLTELVRRRPNRHAWRLGFANAGWRHGLLELHMIVQDYEAALTLAQTQARRDDIDEVTRNRYRLVMLSAMRYLDRKDEIIARLRTWMEESEDSGAWISALAHEYIRQDTPELAVSLLEPKYVSGADRGPQMGGLVDALNAAGQYDRAAQYLLEWLMVNPENDQALGGLIAVLAQDKRVEEGLELVRNKLLQTVDRERFQDLSLALLDLADRHVEAADLAESLLGDVVAVMRSFRNTGGRSAVEDRPAERRVGLPNEPFSMARLDDRLLTLRTRLAGQLVSAKDYHGARGRLSEWIDDARDPQSRFMYLVGLAACYRAEGNEEEAGNVLERVLALRPDNIGLNNDVAYGWIDRGVKLDQAEKMIRLAVSRQPRQMAYLDTFGWLLYKKHEYAEAKKWIERAARIGNQKDPVVQDHMGDTCWRMGLSEEALEHWKLGLELARERAKKDQQTSADERRVLSTVEDKIKAAGSGRWPAVAPVAVTPDASEDAGGGAAVREKH